MVKELAEHFDAGKQLARLPVRDARREQVARLAPRAGGRARRPARSASGCRAKALAQRLYDRLLGARAGPRRGRASSRASSTCSSAATAPTGSARSTRRTATSASSCRTSSTPPRRSLRNLLGRGPRRRRLGWPVMSSGPDLYLVCKSCGAEVSPYITECPYCGTRIQKRAPKLDRGGVPRRRASAPARGRQLPRLRPGEIPGIRADTAPVGRRGCSSSRRCWSPSG